MASHPANLASVIRRQRQHFYHDFLLVRHTITASTANSILNRIAATSRGPGHLFPSTPSCSGRSCASLASSNKISCCSNRKNVYNSITMRPIPTTRKLASNTTSIMSTIMSSFVATIPPLSLLPSTKLTTATSSLSFSTDIANPAAVSPSNTTANTTSTTATKRPPAPIHPIVWTTNQLTKDQMIKVDNVFHKILWLDMFEIHILTELMLEKLGIVLTPKQRATINKLVRAHGNSGNTTSSGQEEDSDASSIAAAKAAQEAAANKPRLFELKLVGFDEKSKIKVIKEVRAIIPGLGLKEAKELVESIPKVLQKDLKGEQAEELKKKLEDVGAKVEVI